MEIRYAFKPKDLTNIARGMGRDLDISFKHAVEISTRLNGMMVNDAIKLLEGVISLEQVIPFRKYKKGVGHRKGLRGYNLGRYPKKAAGEIFKIINNVVSNANYKGLDAEKLKIVNIQALKGVSRLRRKQKGRHRTIRRQFVHVQITAKET